MKSIVLTLKLEEIKRRREDFQRGITLLFVFTLLLFFSTKSFGQCEMKFEYEVENCTPGKSDGKIYIKMVEGEGNYTLKLYDLPNGKFLSERKFNGKKNEKLLVYDNLTSSAYTVYVFKSGCDKHLAVGDKYGILVLAQ